MATAAPSLHTADSFSPRRLQRPRHQQTIASAIGNSPGSRSISVRVVAAPCCHLDLFRAPLDRTPPAGSTVHETSSSCCRCQDPLCVRSFDGRLPASVDCPAPGQTMVLTAGEALAAVSATATPHTTGSQSLLTATPGCHHCGDLHTIPIVRLSPSGLVQSGFNEVAPCCDPLAGCATSQKPLDSQGIRNLIQDAGWQTEASMDGQALFD